MKCVECNSETTINLGTSSNPLCVSCYNHLQELYRDKDSFTKDLKCPYCGGTSTQLVENEHCKHMIIKPELPLAVECKTCHKSFDLNGKPLGVKIFIAYLIWAISLSTLYALFKYMLSIVDYLFKYVDNLM